MGKLRVTVQGNLGEIAAETFVSVLDNTLWILRDLDRRISSERRGTLHWVVTGLGPGSTVVELDTVVVRGEQDISRQVHHGWVAGLEWIRREEATPELFTGEDMAKIRTMVRSFIKNGVPGLSYTNLDDDQQAEISRTSHGAIQQLVGVYHKSLGSIEGRIELVSIHKRYRKFNVYHAITGKAIRCNLPQDMESRVFDAAEERRRVVVSGLISYNIKGEPLSVAINKPLQFLKQEKELPTIQDMLGIDPEITGVQSTEAYIRSLRE